MSHDLIHVASFLGLHMSSFHTEGGPLKSRKICKVENLHVPFIVRDNKCSSHANAMEHVLLWCACQTLDNSQSLETKLMTSHDSVVRALTEHSVQNVCTAGC